jgi:hypothetical protein
LGVLAKRNPSCALRTCQPEPGPNRRLRILVRSITMMLRTRCFDSGMSIRNLTAHSPGRNQRNCFIARRATRRTAGLHRYRPIEIWVGVQKRIGPWRGPRPKRERVATFAHVARSSTYAFPGVPLPFFPCFFVARMERSAIREGSDAGPSFPYYAPLHPGYSQCRLSRAPVPPPVPGMTQSDPACS